MATYTSKAVTVARPATEIAEKFSDFSRLQSAIEAMPADKRAQVGDISFTADTINIHTPQVGDIRLRAVERNANGLVLQAEGSPVAMKLSVSLKPVAESSTEVTGSIDVDIPAMLKPMLGPTMQKAVDKFGQLFSDLA